MNTTDPIPSYFGVSYVLRYMLWWAWGNPVTILGTLQLVFQALTIPDPDGKLPVDLTHAEIHWIAIANLLLMVIVAQVRKRVPVTTPAPLKGVSP